tara:strand:- start:6272 stop:6478 length:207 start_codon:yes stop_codon:yes gene_type:complete
MKINPKQIGQDILTAYIVIAIDVFGGFEANLNILNWSSSKVTKFIILFGIITLINFVIHRFKKKINSI